MNDDLLAVVLQQIPDESTIIQPGSNEFDDVAGGRRGEAFGAPAWAYYSTFAGQNPDGSKRSGGTTCSTFVAYWMSRAGGWPADMIDRAPTDPVAPGGGYTPGSSLSKIIFGAKRRGWYKNAGSLDLQPGDVYHVVHPQHANSDHIGIVRAVGEAEQDGTREVCTVDGGQGTGADARWQSRILSADGTTLSLDGVPARLLGWVRATGGPA
jgi:hypothetical protein